jgi:predicted transcriptional regulator
MRQITLEVPDPLAQRLARLVAEQQKSVEQFAVEQLEAVVEPSAEDLNERYERFFKESGLFIEVPDEVKRRCQPMSEEQRRELAAELGAAGPLSEVIIEERGKR